MSRPSTADIPALATVGIFTFWWTWNSFFEPYVYLSSPQQYTVALGLPADLLWPALLGVTQLS